jgi:S-adenosylmethionine hydrolase
LSIVFLISDFQSDSYKIGLLKHSILAKNKDIDIIDITHNIRLNNTIEAAFVAKQLQLSENQSGIVVMNVGKPARLIVYQHLLNLYILLYILPDNGLLTMLFDQPDLSQVYQAETGSAADVIALWKRSGLSELKKAGNSLRISYNKQVNIQGNYLISEVLFSDRHGNCYFNLTKDVFDGFVKGKPFSFRIQHYTGQIFDRVGHSVTDVNPGEALITFSRNGFLKLQINLGNAKQLFRIKDDTKIILETA